MQAINWFKSNGHLDIAYPEPQSIQAIDIRHLLKSAPEDQIKAFKTLTQHETVSIVTAYAYLAEEGYFKRLYAIEDEKERFMAAEKNFDALLKIHDLGLVLDTGLLHTTEYTNVRKDWGHYLPVTPAFIIDGKCHNTFVAAGIGKMDAWDGINTHEASDFRQSGLADLGDLSDLNDYCDHFSGQCQLYEGSRASLDHLFLSVFHVTLPLAYHIVKQYPEANYDACGNQRKAWGNLARLKMVLYAKIIAHETHLSFATAFDKLIAVVRLEQLSYQLYFFHTPATLSNIKINVDEDGELIEDFDNPILPSFQLYGHDKQTMLTKPKFLKQGFGLTSDDGQTHCLGDESSSYPIIAETTALYESVYALLMHTHGFNYYRAYVLPTIDLMAKENLHEITETHCKAALKKLDQAHQLMPHKLTYWGLKKALMEKWQACIDLPENPNVFTTEQSPCAPEALKENHVQAKVARRWINKTLSARHVQFFQTPTSDAGAANSGHEENAQSTYALAIHIESGKLR